MPKKKLENQKVIYAPLKFQWNQPASTKKRTQQVGCSQKVNANMAVGESLWDFLSSFTIYWINYCLRVGTFFIFDEMYEYFV